MVYTSDKALYVNADKSRVVPGDSPEAAFLLVGEGGQLSDEDAAKYGLTKPETKEAKPAADKAVKAADVSNKAAK